MKVQNFLNKWKDEGFDTHEARHAFKELTDKHLLTEQESETILGAKTSAERVARFDKLTGRPNQYNFLAVMWYQFLALHSMTLWESFFKLSIASIDDAQLGMQSAFT